MRKIIVLICCCLCAMGCKITRVDNLVNVFNNARSIEVFNNGLKKEYKNTDSEFNTILNAFNMMMLGGHDMPAFGVSSNEIVKTEIKNGGLFLQFVFDKEYMYNNLNFSKLLIEIQPNFCGFNIHRFTAENGYNGRCFYYDLKTNTSVFYEFMKVNFLSKI